MTKTRVFFSPSFYKGNCTFLEKISLAAAANASAVIIFNDMENGGLLFRARTNSSYSLPGLCCVYCLLCFVFCVFSLSSLLFSLQKRRKQRKNESLYIFSLIIHFSFNCFELFLCLTTIHNHTFDVYSVDCNLFLCQHIVSIVELDTKCDTPNKF
jgi:hypothetical protein